MSNKFIRALQWASKICCCLKSVCNLFYVDRHLSCLLVKLTISNGNVTVCTFVTVHYFFIRKYANTTKNLLKS